MSARFTRAYNCEVEFIFGTGAQTKVPFKVFSYRDGGDGGWDFEWDDAAGADFNVTSGVVVCFIVRTAPVADPAAAKLNVTAHQETP